MKFLIMSDIHGEFSNIPALLNRVEDIDAIIIAGDITNFGPKEKIHELMSLIVKKCPCPIIVIPGNCDPIEIHDDMTHAGMINIHNSFFILKDVLFIGAGGSNPTPFNTPFELQEDEIRTNLKKLFSNITSHNGKIILLSHAPPKYSLDAIPARIGSEAIYEMVDKVDMIICGHIHEARGFAISNGTPILNPGQASKGLAAILEISRNEKNSLSVNDIEITFIDLL
ncbi:MAG: metallophosphoesterase [Methanosarcinaceae archaeon]|jgi:Icc-related predicted phosphoesterase|nr:metallophosphoesterase [Methanosarcinaceae archaeon]NKQ39263.1 metallophosphoesterase [Methanosarcinales archaeon]